MRSAVAAGSAYFALVFAVGFALGTLRVLVLAPRLGEIGSIALELAVMLLVSWLACGWLLDRFAVPRAPRHRAAMGGVAFALLLAAELAISVLAFGRSPSEHLAAYRSWAAGLGLAAQMVFAAFPLLRPDRGAPGGCTASRSSRK
jgi:hypothetical protein